MPDGEPIGKWFSTLPDGRRVLDFNPEQINGHTYQPVARYVTTDSAWAAIAGREEDLLRAFGADWPPARGATHIHCPYSGHKDNNPSFRLMEPSGGRRRVVCSGNCVSGGKPHSLFDFIMYVRDVDFETAKLWAVETLGRTDLIISPLSGIGLTLDEFAAAKRLPIDKLQRFGLFTGTYSKKNAVVFRYQTGQRFRVKMEGDKRFFWNKGDKVSLYGLEYIPEFQQRFGYVFAPEGETNTLTLWCCGVPAVGIPGAPSGFSDKRDAIHLKDFQAIYVPFDPDDAGDGLRKSFANSSIRHLIRVIKLPDGIKDISEWYISRGKERFMVELREAFEQAQPLPEETEELRAGAERTIPKREGMPIIKVGGGQLPFNLDEAELFLANFDDNVFQRGDFLVRLANDAVIEISKGRKTTAKRLIRVTIPHLCDRLTRVIDFQIFDKKEKNFRSVNCSKDIAQGLIERHGEWTHIRPIKGLVTAPTVRPDGSLLTEPGYDEKTGLLFDPGNLEYDIPERVSKEQAREILDTVLIPLFEEFPFVDEEGRDAKDCASPSRSVMLSHLFTSIARAALATVPLHAYSATAAGSGKSHLVDTISVIATGTECAVIMQNESSEETQKNLGASLLAGDPMISFDNCERPIGGELLNMCITQALVKIRILGRSEQQTVPNTATWSATGNNLVIAEDIRRRTIRCMLDPKLEQPELREFRNSLNPVERAKQDRAKYVVAVLSIVRAFQQAGSPVQSKTPLAGFVDWSNKIRDCLIWLGESDPVITQESTRKNDPVRLKVAAVLYQWEKVIGAEIIITAKAVIDKAGQMQSTGNTGFDFNRVAFVHSELREALLAVAADHHKPGSLSPDRLGTWLRRHSGQVVDGMRFAPAGIYNGNKRWKLERLAPPVGGVGGLGGSNLPP